MKDFTPTEYLLECVATGRRFGDHGWCLDDIQCGEPSLVRAVYAKKQLEVGEDSHGLYKFADWLPVCRTLKGSSAPVTYKSGALGAELGLENLYITFNGWWPERGAAMASCSFKETEAFSVCGRLPEDNGRVLVVASAGNTARAFAKVCSDNKIPLLLSVPEDNLDALWFEGPLDECVKLVCPERGGDYFDAIHLGNVILAGSDRFMPEGGAKNVARRDGMSITVLSAVTVIGRIPDFYFQAVGSGTGAIAAWEANMRFIEDGRYGKNKMKLVVSQNSPFLPMYEAWRNNSRQLPHYDDAQARRDAETIKAKVLSNRKPPYGLAGGLYDALSDTGGDVVAITNAELDSTSLLFERLEGIDIHPAAAVAVSSLIKYVDEGRIDPGAVVMLNITGGGERRFKSSRSIWMLTPSQVFPLNSTDDYINESIACLFK